MYIPQRKCDFYELLGSMILRCPHYRSKIPASDHGIDKSFLRMEESIKLIYKKEDNPIRKQLLRMSKEARRLSDLAIVSPKDETGRSNALAAREIFVDMERLMKGKPLMYYSEQ